MYSTIHFSTVPRATETVLGIRISKGIAQQQEEPRRGDERKLQ